LVASACVLGVDTAHAPGQDFRAAGASLSSSTRRTEGTPLGRPCCPRSTPRRRSSSASDTCSSELLVPHIVLAAFVVPLALTTIHRAWRGRLRPSPAAGTCDAAHLALRLGQRRSGVRPPVPLRPL